ncbi:MAG: ATP-binding protein [Bacteroidia bacterium]|nr:ATP-binding protein [Bacteroidia bacterium]
MDWKNFRIEKLLSWLEQSFPSLKSKRPLQTLILVAFAIVILSLGIMGYFAYSNVSQLNDSLKEASKPYGYVEQLSIAIGAQEEADNLVLNFLIRKSSTRLMNNYFLNIRDISNALVQLDTLPPPSDLDNERRERIEGYFGQMLWNHTRIIRIVGDSTLSADFSKVASQFTRFKGLEVHEQEKDSLFALGFLLNDDVLIRRKMRGRLERMEKRYRIEREERIQEAEQETSGALRFTALFSLFVLTISTILLSVIFNDLNRNRELQERLRREKGRAEKLARVKEDFLANMSHEIRTPMNALMGFAGQLAETPLNQKQIKLLQPIQNSAKYLLALLNDVLDYSKLESQQFSLEKIGFKPLKVLNDVHTTFERVAAKKGIELEFNIDKNSPEVLIGDPIRLKQMLFNLVSNSLKFTEEGSVSVKLEMAELKNGQIWMDFIVEDTGIGIPQEKLSEIFSEFSQADTSISRRYGGTGLGLSITRKLALMHGGNIQLNSEEGKGTRAVLHLGYQVGTVEDVIEEKQYTSIQPDLLKGHKILAADDEPYNRLLIKSILGKWGLELCLCENGRDLLNELEKDSYSLILMDLQMPEMDGIVTTHQIRNKLNNDIPIIALTATSTPDEINRAMKAGMQGHLIKPFEEGQLFNMMCQLLQIEIEDIPEEKEEKTDIQQEDMNPSDAPFDLDKLARLSNQNKAFMQNMLGIFVNGTRENLQGVQEAQAKGDWLEVSQRFHKIIPPCRHLGMYELVGRLKVLELELKKENPDKEFKDKVAPISKELQKVVELVEAEMES